MTILSNRYEILEKIGEGGMAVVYRGRDHRLNRPVAIKVLHSHYARDPQFLARFQHEAEAAAILNHPNIVRVYDVGQDGGTHYIVMEYVDGENLKALIHREAPMEIARAITIAEEVARGLAAAHQVGLVHRDIKPQNILISRGEQRVQITDFGIARSHLSPSWTQTGITMGTADYISPEQAQGQKATPQSDLYALGVTLYEMLTGQLPFTGDNPVTIALHHVNTPPPAPRSINPHIPVGLEALLLRVLAKNPSERPASAEEMVQLLRTYQASAVQPTRLAMPAPRSTPPLPAAPQVQQPQVQPPPPQIPDSLPHASVDALPTPPRTATALKAPQYHGVGCGGFIIGAMILAGILLIILAFTSGMLDPLLTGYASLQPPPAPGVASTWTPAERAANPTPTPTETPTETPEPLIVPNVVGKGEEEAKRVLEKAGFVPVRGGQRKDARITTVGSVAAQDPPAGSEAPKGATITYILSLGPERVIIELPDWTNQRLDSARRDAEKRGLHVETREEASKSVSEGFIIRQEPVAGMKVEEGDTVLLIVSVGDRVWLPDLRHKSEEEAKRILEQTDGVYWSWSDYQGPEKIPDFDHLAPGTVVSSEPPGAQWVRRGTGVTLGVRRPG